MQEGGKCRREEEPSTAMARSPLVFPTALPGPSQPPDTDPACRAGEAGVKAHGKVVEW